MTNGRSQRAGILLHAKHALTPNGLGYCGPDQNGKILDHLHGSKAGDDLVSVLSKFEAAYPFIRMIGESTGRDPFDYSVTEAYWIGNSLLDRVAPTNFFEFASRDLKSKMGRSEAKTLFRDPGFVPKPHHSFYVMSLFARSGPSPTGDKLLKLMDSCRISWGEVSSVKGRELLVRSSPLRLSGGRLALAPPRTERVAYDPEIPGFSRVKAGDWVSLHWNFASERLTGRQVKNLRKYTLYDIAASNRLAQLGDGWEG